MWGGEFYFLVLLLFVTAALAVVGYVLVVLPVRNDSTLCVRRRSAHAFGCIGFLIGGVYWVLTWSDQGRPFFGNPLGGLVLGAVVGELVGAFVARYLCAASEEESL